MNVPVFGGNSTLAVLLCCLNFPMRDIKMASEDVNLKIHRVQSDRIL